jgi:hypothetical protein
MNALTCCRWTVSVSTPAARARTRSRMASWLSSGTQTGELSGTKQPGQRHSIPTISLHMVPRLPRNQRWRDYSAFVPKRADQPVQPIAGWPCLVAKMHIVKCRSDPLNHTTHARLQCINFTERHRRPGIGRRSRDSRCRCRRRAAAPAWGRLPDVVMTSSPGQPGIAPRID